eukprot:9070133-Ditylum_brightwellii.AAC.1
MSETLHMLHNTRETLQPSETFQLPQNAPIKKGALSAKTADTILNTAANVEPSYAWGKGISVPNTKKGTSYYELRYNKDHHSLEELKNFTTK